MKAINKRKVLTLGGGAAVLALLAVLLAPTVRDAIEKAQENKAVRTAQNVYTDCFAESRNTASALAVYDAGDRWVTMKNGVAAGVYESREEALTACLGEAADRWTLSSVDGTDLFIPQYVGPTDWSGASAVFMGDSITEAKNHTSKFYYQYLKDFLDLRSVMGMGKSGSCVADKCTSASIESLYDRYQSIPAGKDLIVIFIGTNDYGHAVELGDENSTDPNTFYGSLNTVLPYLIENHPNSQIVVLTPMHRSGFVSGGLNAEDCGDGSPNKIGNVLLDYVNALKNACARHAVPVIDLYTLVTEDPMDTSFFNDGLHPGTAGHEKIAEIMAEELKKIQRKGGDGT